MNNEETIIALQARIAKLESELASKITMSPMQFEDGRQGWFISTPYFYCDIEPDEAGQYSVFFRDVNGKEGYGEKIIST